MTIDYECKCGLERRFKDDAAGKRKTCPDCGRTFRVPQPLEADEPPEVDDTHQAEPPVRRKKKKRPKGPWLPWLPRFSFEVSLFGLSGGQLLFLFGGLLGVVLLVVLFVPGLGTRAYYSVEAFSGEFGTSNLRTEEAEEGIFVSIHNTGVGTIKERLVLAVTVRDLRGRSEERQVLTKVKVQGNTTKNNRTVHYEIVWTKEQGVSEVTVDGKKVVRSWLSSRGKL